MKKGDVVTVKDSSYSKVVTESGLESSYAGVNSVRGERGVVIEVDCKFPNPHKYQQQYKNRFNNTIIMTDSGKVVFIEECFLRPVLPKHKVMIGITQSGPVTILGQIVEVSDKLYKEIKRDSQTQ